jgi:hypothetical protein
MVKEAFRDVTQRPFRSVDGSVAVVTRDELARCGHWAAAFCDQRKDHRYYELVEDTICPDFEYRYVAVKDADGEIRAVQPFFVLDQDMLAGIDNGAVRRSVGVIRRLWPRFMRTRTLMLGCAAGEGHLDNTSMMPPHLNASLVAGAITQLARGMKASLIVLKEFPAEYRRTLDCFVAHGFTRVPSLPMVRLNIDYADFDDYMRRAVSTGTRSDLRRKFRAAERAAPIQMSVMTDITPIIDEVYPLYLQVVEHTKLRFEILTREYFCRIGRRMPDKVRFFVWRQSGRVIAFSLSMVQGDTISNEYLGLDYKVALDLHMYFYAFRDIVTWAIANNYKWCESSGSNYDPKWHLRFSLCPLDLYVRHTSRPANAMLRLMLPWLEPTRYDKTLPQFPNYHELWDHGLSPDLSSGPLPASVDVVSSQMEKKKVA